MVKMKLFQGIFSPIWAISGKFLRRCYEKADYFFLTFLRDPFNFLGVVILISKVLFFSATLMVVEPPTFFSTL